MRDGKKSRHPGIRQDGENAYLVRVTMMDPHERRQREKEQRVEGTLSDAIRAREDLRDQMRREIDDDHKRQALGIQPEQLEKEILSVYANRWLKHLANTGRNRVHTINQHVHLLDRFILPTLGVRVVAELTPLDMVMWMESLSELDNHGKPYAKLTLNGAWATLRTMLKDAVILCGLKSDPTEGVRFRVRGTDPVAKDVLTHDELGRILDATQHESADIRAMIWVGVTTGMRFGELSALEWGDIDFERGLIHVRKSQVAGVVGPTKTNSHRSVPLHPMVASILHAHKGWQTVREVKGRERLVFPSEKGGYRFSNVMTKPLLRCAEHAKLDKHVTAHTMRRTFNNLARQAAGEIVARSMTGHTTTAMTEHYSHVTLEEKSRALQAALGPLGSPQRNSGSEGAEPQRPDA